MRRAVLVVNPFASQVTDERVEAVRSELERGASVETLFTERPGHAVELVEGRLKPGLLLGRDADGRVGAWSAGLVHGDPVGPR